MTIRKPWFCQECRVIMQYNPELDYYVCPECGVEVWPPGASNTTAKKNDEITDLMRDMHKANLPRKEAMPIYPVPAGGGGSKSSKGRKKDTKKKSLSQLNAGLAGTCAAFNA